MPDCLPLISYCIVNYARIITLSPKAKEKRFMLVLVFVKVFKPKVHLKVTHAIA